MAETAASNWRARLGIAMTARGLSERGLAKKLDERGVRGATRQMVRNYRDGDHSPTLEWLRHAAEALNVHEEWLLYNIQPMSRDLPSGRTDTGAPGSYVLGDRAPLWVPTEARQLYDELIARLGANDAAHQVVQELIVSPLRAIAKARGQPIEGTPDEIVIAAYTSAEGFEGDLFAAAAVNALLAARLADALYERRPPSWYSKARTGTSTSQPRKRAPRTRRASNAKTKPTTGRK